MTSEEKAVVDAAIGLLIELTQKTRISRMLGNVDNKMAYEVSFNMAPLNALKEAVRKFAVAQPGYIVNKRDTVEPTPGSGAPLVG